MFTDMTATDKGTGRKQPINLLELLSLPGKSGKGSRSRLTNTAAKGIPSFMEMLTEGLQSQRASANPSLPPDESDALTLVAGAEKLVGPSADLTTAVDGKLPQASLGKPPMGKEENQPVEGGINSDITSLFAAANLYPGTLPANSAGGNDRSSQPQESEDLFLDKMVKQPVPASDITGKLGEAGRSVGEKADPRHLVSSDASEVEDMPAGLQTLPQWSNQALVAQAPAEINPIGPSQSLPVEDIKGQAASVSAAINAQPQKEILASKEATDATGAIGQGREAFRLAQSQAPLGLQRQVVEASPLDETEVIAAPKTAAADNTANQAAALATATNAQPQKETLASKEATETIGALSRGRDAFRLAQSQAPLGLQRQVVEGSPLDETEVIATHKAAVADNTANQAAALATAMNAQPQKETLASKEAPDTAGAADPERERVGLPEAQTQPSLLRQAQENTPPTRINVIVPPPSPALENMTGQTAAAAPINDKTEETAPIAKGAARPSVTTDRMPEALVAMEPHNPPQRAQRSVNGAPQAGSAVPLPPLAPEITTNQAAAAAAVINPRPAKAGITAGEAVEPRTGTDKEAEAILPRYIRESLAKAGFDEFMSARGNANNPPMSDRLKPHQKESFAVPELMEINVNAAGSQPIKGQAVPTAALLEQVAVQLPQAISKGSGRVRLSLEPDSLGKLDMDLVVRENRVQIVLTAESHGVQQTLQGHVEQLRDALQQRGLEVDGFNVLLQNGSQGQSDTAARGNPFWSGYNPASADKRSATGDSFPAAASPFVPGQGLNKGTEGINIFV